MSALVCKPVRVEKHSTVSLTRNMSMRKTVRLTLDGRESICAKDLSLLPDRWSRWNRGRAAGCDMYVSYNRLGGRCALLGRR